MNFFDTDISYVCLSFDEANILVENFRKQDLAGLIARLDNLLRHTSDPHLLNELRSLLRKLQNLTPEEYSVLARDIESGAILFPPGYTLPYLG